MSMKIDELMIGDWVNLNFDVDYKTGNSIYGHVQVASINKDGTIDVDCTFDNSKSMQDGWYLKLIEPIPLTPEILEKNFELLFRKKYIYIYSGINGRFIIQNHYNVKGWYWSLDYDEQTGFSSAFGRVNYIHELQHILRLCKISKEIVV